jgi:hypothetical protein
MGTVERLKKPEPERTEPIRQWNAGDGAAFPDGDAPEAVDMGYRVIDEYLQQGRRAAESLGLGGGIAGGLAAAGSFQALSARLFSDALVWLEHLARLTTPSDSEARPPKPGVAGSSAQGFGVRVVSASPVEVDLRLEPGCDDRALGVHDLREADSDAPALPVELAHRERWHVGLRVPADQPHGLYTGIVYDRSDGSICGTVAVRVGET